ncbi:MAG: alpha-amylase, partial [Chlorobium sp.]
FVPISGAELHQNPGIAYEYMKETYLAYGKDPYFDPWTDTLQLNYARKETHKMMTENLFKISSLCDAVRCDVAMLILKSVFNTTWSNLGGIMEEEFWSNAIAAIKLRHPDFIFLAEAYWNKEWELQQQGFDYTYDKPFYDYLSNGAVNVEKLTGHLLGNWEYQKHLCRFLENHDEPRAAEKIGLNHKAAALVMLTSPGMHLIHQDQIYGFSKRIPVQLLRQATETSDTKLAEFYQKLFLLQEREVFQEGRVEWINLNAPYNSHCLGFHRFTAKENAYVLANFSGTGIALEFQHHSLEDDNIKKLSILSTENKNKKSISYIEKVMKLSLAPHEALVITCVTTVAAHQQ